MRTLVDHLSSRKLSLKVFTALLVAWFSFSFLQNLDVGVRLYVVREKEDAIVCWTFEEQGARKPQQQIH